MKRAGAQFLPHVAFLLVGLDAGWEHELLDAHGRDQRGVANPTTGHTGLEKRTSGRAIAPIGH